MRSKTSVWLSSNKLTPGLKRIGYLLLLWRKSRFCRYRISALTDSRASLSWAIFTSTGFKCSAPKKSRLSTLLAFEDSHRENSQETHVVSFFCQFDNGSDISWCPFAKSSLTSTYVLSTDRLDRVAIRQNSQSFNYVATSILPPAPTKQAIMLEQVQPQEALKHWAQRKYESYHPLPNLRCQARGPRECRKWLVLVQITGCENKTCSAPCDELRIQISLHRLYWYYEPRIHQALLPE